MEFLESLQNSAFGMWVAGAPTIWAYPTVLTLHAVGMAMAVGASAVLDLRLLGVAPHLPLAELKSTFRPMWIGFAINAVSGVVLFIAAAADTGIKPVFYIKLTLILFALLTASRIRRVVFGDQAAPDAPIPQQARILAAASLVLWTGAIVSGRLMAYIH
jgi:hypothetical protein